MDLNKKIDEIRSQPENIRRRYVWGTVGICMTFVLILWVFSAKETMKSMSEQVESSGSYVSDFKNKFNEPSREETPSIKEILDQTGQRLEAGMTDDRQPITNNQ